MLQLVKTAGGLQYYRCRLCSNEGQPTDLLIKGVAPSSYGIAPPQPYHRQRRHAPPDHARVTDPFFGFGSAPGGTPDPPAEERPQHLRDPIHVQRAKATLKARDDMLARFRHTMRYAVDLRAFGAPARTPVLARALCPLGLGQPRHNWSRESATPCQRTVGVA